MDRSSRPVDFDLRAIRGTFLGDLDDEERALVLRGARIFEAARGGAIFPEGPRTPRAGVLIDGTARTFLVAPDGRQFTVRYVRSGAVMASVSGLGGEQVPIGIEATTECIVLELDVANLYELTHTRQGVAVSLLGETSRRIEQAYAVMAATAFASTRERLAAHLLELAERRPHSSELVASVTQQQLADALGTVREVVARTLRELREAGAVDTQPGLISLRDPDRLREIAGRWRVPHGHYLVDPTLPTDRYIDLNPNPVLAIDRTGSILYANEAVSPVFGWLPRELVGTSIERLLPVEVLDRHDAHLESFFARPSARPMGIGLDLHARRADGSEFPVEISLAPTDTPSGTVVFATVFDLSHRSEIRQSLERVRAGSQPRT